MSREKAWDERYAAKELVWSAGPNELFARHVTGLKPAKALDVACGEGRNAVWLAEQGWHVTGIDFSQVGLDKARQIAAARGVEVDFQRADVAEHALESGYYDLVAVLYLHTSAEERKRWLANVVDAVKPGGTFIYVGHDPSNIDRGVGGPQDPQLLPDAAEISAALTHFRVDAAAVVERPVAGESGHGGTDDGVALDTFVRAVRHQDEEA